MYRSSKLNLLNLERRDVPAQFGIPWANHQISLSFVPDGTNVDGMTSSLMSFFGASGIGENAGKIEILRAMQAWAAKADLTVGVVGDNGAAIGVGGQSQHDLRFGDIRISGRPMSSNVLAISIPPGPAAGTRAGDIIINTSQPLNVGGGSGKFDLYSCMLQETGHALGIGNSTNVNSAMYETYMGARSGIIMDDVNTVVALYGNRNQDGFDQVTDNGSAYIATALAIPTSLTANAESNFDAVADISTPIDRDYYSFVVPNNSAGNIAVRLVTDGISLLRGRLTVLSAAQEVLFDVRMNDQGNGTLVDVLASAKAGEKYYLRVERGNDNGEFDVGRYKVQVDFNPAANGDFVGISNSTNSWVFNDDHVDDAIASAKQLAANANRSGEYGITARFVDAADVDAYQISVPGANGNVLLTVSINAANTGMRPTLTLLDATSASIAFQVTHNADGLYSLQANVAKGQTVYLVAKADASSATVVGDYRLDASTNAGTTPLTSFVSSTLTSAHPALSQFVTVTKGLVAHFVLTASAANPSNDFGAVVLVKNEAGVVVMEFGAMANRSVSATKYLSPGIYQIIVGGSARIAGSTLPNLAVSLKGFSLSDPIDPVGGSSDLDDGLHPPASEDGDWFDWDYGWWWWL